MTSIAPKERVRALVNRLTSRPEPEIDAAGRYQSARRRAGHVGVDQLFIDRASAIASEPHMVELAVNFLEFYISLEVGRPVEGFGDDFSRQIVTPEERNRTIELVEAVLGNGGLSRDHAVNLRLQLFRLRQVSLNDPELRDFIYSELEAAAQQRVGGYKSRDKSFSIESATRAISEANAIFDRQGSRFFLLSGTLLGVIRDGGFMKNDYDIDLGVFADEVSTQQLKEMFANSSFTIDQDFEHKIGFVDDAGVVLEFFICHRRPDSVVLHGWRDVHSWYFSYFDLIELPAFGHTAWVPDNYEKHLAENFGNWRQGTVHYDVSYNVPNRVYGKNSASLYYLTTRMCRAIDNGWRGLSEWPAEQLKHVFDLEFSDEFVQWPERRTLPSNMPQYEPSPAIVVSLFDSIEVHDIRVIESAKSLCGNVVVAVVNDDVAASLVRPEGPLKAVDRVRLAKEVRHVSDAYAEDLTFEAYDMTAVPKVVIVDSRFVETVAAKLPFDCPVVGYDRNTVCITLSVDGSVTTR